MARPLRRKSLIGGGFRRIRQIARQQEFRGRRAFPGGEDYTDDLARAAQALGPDGKIAREVCNELIEHRRRRRR